MNKRINQFFKTIIFSSIVLISMHSNAQEVNEGKEQTKFKLQCDYLSNYVYNGRADSVKSPYQTTSASLNFANGLYLTGAANYLLEKGQNRFDYFEFDLGYDYKLGEKISGGVYGSKYFYSGNANLLNGNISSDIGASLNYDLGFLQFNNTFDLFFSNSSDFQYTPSIEKSFSIDDENGNWNITPSIGANLSTVNFYESVINRRLNAKGPKGKLPNLPTVTNITKVNNGGFKLLDLELTLPISYETGKWGFTLTPTLAMPQNPILTNSTVTTTSTTGITSVFNYNSTPYSEKNLKNTFFVQLGLSYTF